MSKEPLSLRFAKTVEANRRNLITNVRKNGKNIDDNASLSEVVSVNNSIFVQDDGTQRLSKYEVRFFDADGTKLGDSIWVESGGSVTPPIPNLDPDRLEFVRWASAIGDRTDNITHDVDYMALYKTKEDKIHVFIELNDVTGYSVSLPLCASEPNANGNYTGEISFEVDWGDGNTDSQSITGLTGSWKYARITHTYTEPGRYEIVCTPSREYVPEHPDRYGAVVYGVYPSYTSFLSTATANNNIDLAVYKVYSPYVAGWFRYNYNLKYIVYRHLSTISAGGGNQVMPIHNIVLHGSHPKYISNGYAITIREYTERVIIDPSCTMWGTSNQGVSFTPYMDKLILPTTGPRITTLNGAVDKLVIVGNGTRFVPTSMDAFNYLKEIHFTENYTQQIPLSGTEYAYVLTKFENQGLAYIPNLQNLYCIESFVIPSGAAMTYLNVFANSYRLKDLQLYPDFDYALNLSNCKMLSMTTCLSILNNIRDNSDTTAKTLSFSTDFKHRLRAQYVKKVNDFYDYCSSTEEGAITMAQAFANKNWTVSI